MDSNNQAEARPTTSAASDPGSSDNQAPVSAAAVNQNMVETSGFETRVGSMVQGLRAALGVPLAEEIVEEALEYQRILRLRAVMQSQINPHFSLRFPTDRDQDARSPPIPPLTRLPPASGRITIPGGTREEPQGINITMPDASRKAARTFSQRSSDSEPDSDTATQEVVRRKLPRLGPANNQQSATVTPPAQFPARRGTVVYRGSDVPSTPATPTYLGTEQISVKKRGSTVTPASAGPSSAHLPSATTPGPSTPASGFGTRVPTPFSSSDSNATTSDGSTTPRGAPRGFKTGSTSSTPTQPKRIIRRPRRSPSVFIDPKTYRPPRVPSGGSTGSTGSKVTPGSAGTTGDGGSAGTKQNDSRYSPRKGDAILLPFGFAPQQLEELQKDPAKMDIIRGLQKKAQRPKENPLRAEQERLWREENPDLMDVDEEDDPQ